MSARWTPTAKERRMIEAAAKSTVMTPDDVARWFNAPVAQIHAIFAAVRS